LPGGVSEALFALLKDYLPGYRGALAEQAEDRLGLKPEEPKPWAQTSTARVAEAKMFAEHPTVHEGIAAARQVADDDVVGAIAREQRRNVHGF
jgi:hypothetical protein